MSDGTYMYAVGRATSGPDTPSGIIGIGGRLVRFIEHDGLRATVSSVDLDEFGDDALKKNLEDLTWLERTARDHDTVITQLTQWGSVAPLRFATICFDDAGVRQRLEEWKDELERVLARIDGRVEWGVKAYDTATETTPDAPGGAGSGTDYLKRRRTANSARAGRAEAAAALAEELHGAIRTAAVASRRLPPQDPQLSGKAAMTLNGTYLVDEAGCEDFEALVTGLGVEHPDAHLELNGPWPPYSFAALDEP